MDELIAMGFGREAAQAALSMNSHNFDNALSMLLSQQSHEQVRDTMQALYEHARAPVLPKV